MWWIDRGTEERCFFQEFSFGFLAEKQYKVVIQVYLYAILVQWRIVPDEMITYIHSTYTSSRRYLSMVDFLASSWHSLWVRFLTPVREIKGNVISGSTCGESLLWSGCWEENPQKNTGGTDTSHNCSWWLFLPLGLSLPICETHLWNVFIENA